MDSHYSHEHASQPQQPCFTHRQTDSFPGQPHDAALASCAESSEYTGHKEWQCGNRKPMQAQQGAHTTGCPARNTQKPAKKSTQRCLLTACTYVPTPVQHFLLHCCCHTAAHRHRTPQQQHQKPTPTGQNTHCCRCIWRPTHHLAPATEGALAQFWPLLLRPPCNGVSAEAADPTFGVGSLSDTHTLSVHHCHCLLAAPVGATAPPRSVRLAAPRPQCPAPHPQRRPQQPCPLG